MRILQVTDLYTPVVGGLERHVELLTEALRGRGHDVHVAALSRPHDGAVDVSMLPSWLGRVPRVHQDASRPLHPTFPDPGVVAALRRLLAKLRPDVVHVHGWILYSALRAVGDAYPLVVTLHDYGLVCPKKTLMDGDGVCGQPCLSQCVRAGRQQYGTGKAVGLAVGLRVGQRWHGRVDRFIAVSEAVASVSAQGVGTGRAQVRVIPPFLPSGLGSATSAERPAFLPERNGYLLYVGALGRHKGVHVLLEAHALLGNDAPPLLLIGTGTWPEPLPPGVTIAREVPHPVVMAAYAASSVTVVPSVCAEAFGQVATEAMSVGVPVVASRTGGLQDIVEDGVTGVLVPPGDAGALAGALRRLLSDPTERSRLGAASRAAVSRYGEALILPRIEQVYTEAVAARARLRGASRRPT